MVINKIITCNFKKVYKLANSATFKQNEKSRYTWKNAIHFNIVPTLDFHVFKTILLRRFPKTDNMVHGTKQIKTPNLEWSLMMVTGSPNDL